MNFKNNVKRFFTLSRNAEGFTLVELIVVIAILGILAGVALPAYGGYVEKSKKAVDDQSLAVVNSVLTVACVSNKADVSDITAATLTLTSNKVTAISVTGPATAADIQTDFMLYLGDVSFKTYEPTWDNTAKQFVGPDGASGGNGGNGGSAVPGVFQGAANNINSDDKNAFNNSQFGTIGAGEVMGQVGTVTDLAAGLFETGNSPELQAMLGAGLGNLGSFLTDDELAKYGEDGDSKEVLLAKYTDSLIKQKFEAMYPGVDYEAAKEENSEYYAKYTSVMGQVAANAAVLNAAKNTSSASYSTMQNLLSTENGSNPKSNLLAAVKNDPNTGLAQVSAAYGLYYAYMDSQGKTVSNNPTEVLAGMNDEGFLNYVANVDKDGNEIKDSNKAQTDLAGYNAAMNMVNSSVTNKDQAEYVVMNGFSDAGLEALMKEILGG